ncbi:hypothetical protein ABDF71_24375 [Ochrobactrum sp. WV_118_8]|jgi:hypothetical protein|uniref:hypothetical protein n=1 Tax=Ochrobactrum sp. A-1 TaxID=2920940 RepID=UPI001F0B5281|nr:hypothetical protein [Ochrobactrum sp. A-1]
MDYLLNTFAQMPRVVLDNLAIAVLVSLVMQAGTAVILTKTDLVPQEQRGEFYFYVKYAGSIGLGRSSRIRILLLLILVVVFDSISIGAASFFIEMLCSNGNALMTGNGYPLEYADKAMGALSGVLTVVFMLTLIWKGGNAILTCQR